MQDNPTLAQQNEAAAALAPDFDAITAALTSATATLAKRVWTITTTGGGDDACGQDCLIVKVQILVWEVACTLKFVIVKLGLGELIRFTLL